MARPGDLGRIDADGFVHIMGRVKDVIIRGGHNIDPRTIEDAALAFAGVALAPPSAVQTPMQAKCQCCSWRRSPVRQSTRKRSRPSCKKEFSSLQRDRAPSPSFPKCRSPLGKIFKPKLREIASREAAYAVLAAEGLADVEVSAMTDPSRGLLLRVAADQPNAEKALRLLQRFPVRVEIAAH